MGGMAYFENKYTETSNNLVIILTTCKEDAQSEENCCHKLNNTSS